MNFDKEGSKFEKKKMFVCVSVEGRGARCTDTKSVCKTIFFFDTKSVCKTIFFFFFFFLIFFF